MGSEVYSYCILEFLVILRRNFQSRLILFPFPVLVNYVHELKRLIMLNANDDAKLLSYIDILKKIPFSIELARVTDIGYTVNSLGKHSTFKIVSDAARDLTKKWKAIYERLQATSSSSSENTSLDCPTPSNHSHDVNRDSPNITTWRSLYTYCEEETTNIFHVASSKVSQLATNIKASQRGTCTNYSAQQETDEKKKRRLQARLNELKIPTKKPRNMNPSNVEPPKVKMVAIVPLHEQKIKR